MPVEVDRDDVDGFVDELHALGFRLEVAEDRLFVRPGDRLTSDQRDRLARLAPALLARLAPVAEFVSLRGGLVVPLPALLLALDLEQRGFHMALNEADQITIEATGTSGPLTASDREEIARWRLHLGAIVGYVAPQPDWVQ